MKNLNKMYLIWSEATILWLAAGVLYGNFPETDGLYFPEIC